MTDAPKGLRPEAARYAPTRTRRDLRQDAVAFARLLACLLELWRELLGWPVRENREVL